MLLLSNTCIIPLFQCWCSFTHQHDSSTSNNQPCQWVNRRGRARGSCLVVGVFLSHVLLKESCLDWSGWSSQRHTWNHYSDSSGGVLILGGTSCWLFMGRVMMISSSVSSSFFKSSAMMANASVRISATKVGLWFPFEVGARRLQADAAGGWKKE